MEHKRLGEILVEAGVLTQAQVQRVLACQHESHEPFGLLCERLFKIDPTVIEAAWEKQYAGMTRQIDPRVQAFDECAADLITRRQAWQFRVLPIRFENGELVLATTKSHLRRALRFATNVVGIPVYLVLAESKSLGEALCKRYPMPGMTPKSIDDDQLDQVFSRLRQRKCA